MQMELYLDSADPREIEQAVQLGFLYGLTTTPTFMHRTGVTDVDAMIVKMSKSVAVLQVEALGETAEEVEVEAHRILELGLDKKKTVFKIPISLEGAKACKRLTDEGILVNLHLIYTIQQAYIALSAGATYVCPLIGRLQDQGQDALALVEQCVKAVERFGYASKIMFSSVRHPEHVRNALNLGAHACTIPWKVLKQLTRNHFTDIGTREFFEHNRLMTLRVRDVIRKQTCTIELGKTIVDALVNMTRSGLGAVTLVDDSNRVRGVFTDGDLRRLLQEQGNGVLQKPLSELTTKAPLCIQADALLSESSELFKKYKVDTLVVVEKERPMGMLDIQDLI